MGRTPITGSSAKRTERPPAEYSNASGQPSGPGITFMRSGRSTYNGAADAHRFDIRVAGDEQEAVPALQEVGRGVVGRRPRHEIDERVLLDLLGPFIEQQRHRGGGLRDHAH
jgi:hypothetical protein